MNNEHTITIPLNRWIEEKLGPLKKGPDGKFEEHYLENIPIHPDDATVIELCKPLHVHVQRTDLETGKSYSKPLLWNKKHWTKYESRIADVKKQSELRRSSANKYQHNIEEVTQFFMKQYKFTRQTAVEMANKIVMDNIGDPEFLIKFLNIDIHEQTTEERVAVGEYYKKL